MKCCDDVGALCDENARLEGKNAEMAAALMAEVRCEWGRGDENCDNVGVWCWWNYDGSEILCDAHKDQAVYRGGGGPRLDDVRLKARAALSGGGKVMEQVVELLRRAEKIIGLELEPAPADQQAFRDLGGAALEIVDWLATTRAATRGGVSD